MMYPPTTLWRRPFITPDRLNEALSQVETAEGFQASSRHSFKDAIFGRDSLEVGIDILDRRPSTVARILFSVARHIGVEFNDVTEEEPGKGFHEFRNRVMGGREVAEEQLEILRELSKIWGGDGKSLTYYGAADSGALYLILLNRYCSSHGRGICDEHFVHSRTGRVMTIEETIVASAEFYCRKIDESDLGLVEFQHSGPHGIWYQIMRDGHDGMILPDGRLANPDAPIAAIEIQSVAHGGLIAAAALTKDPGLSARWKGYAERLRTSTFEKMWLEDERYFARSIHRDASGQPEVVTTIDSAPAEMLRDTMFDDLHELDKAKYVGGVVDRLFTDEFLTGVGFRMRSKKFPSIGGYWTYQGSNTVWPTVVKRIADGLHRQGLPMLGDEVDARLLRSCETAHDFPEYFFVSDDGHPMYRVTESDEHIDGIVRQPSASRPMSIQAWTASAAFGSYFREESAPAMPGWHHEFSDEILERLWDPFTVYLDRAMGAHLEKEFFDTYAPRKPSFTHEDVPDEPEE